MFEGGSCDDYYCNEGNIDNVECALCDAKFQTHVKQYDLRTSEVENNVLIL